MRPTRESQGLLRFRREGGLQRITDLKLLHDGPESAYQELSVTKSPRNGMSIPLASGDACDSPVTSDLTTEFLGQLHKILLV